MFKKASAWYAKACLWTIIGYLPWCSWAQHVQMPDKPPASSYFQERAFSSAQLSPDGKKVAFKLRIEGSPARLEKRLQRIKRKSWSPQTDLR